MRTLVFALFWIALTTPALADLDASQRLNLAELIFETRFSTERIEKVLLREIRSELDKLEQGAGREDVLAIRKLVHDIATDVVSSTQFRDEYAASLASSFTKDELRAYLDFLRSDLGQKATDFDNRLQPVVAEAIQRRSKGRLQSAALLLAQARSK